VIRYAVFVAILSVIVLDSSVALSQNMGVVQANESPARSTLEGLQPLSRECPACVRGEPDTLMRIMMVRDEAPSVATPQPGAAAPGPVVAQSHGTSAPTPEGASSFTGRFRAFVAGRRAALRAVVRLHDRTGLVCTATIVRSDRGVVLLTAAHCLFHLSPNGTLQSARTALIAEGIGPIDPENVQIDAQFRACAAEHRTWQECVESPLVRDIARIALQSPPDGVAPWSTCTSIDGPEDVTVFGYGLNGRTLPRLLLAGAFRVRARQSSRLREAFGVGVRIEGGDSGGPVISSGDDTRLDNSLPCVRYVAVAVRSRDSNDPGDRSRALLEPIVGPAPPAPSRGPAPSAPAPTQAFAPNFEDGRSASAARP